MVATERRTNVGWLATFSLLAAVHTTPSGRVGLAPVLATVIDAMIQTPVAAATAPQISDDMNASCIEEGRGR